MHVARYSAIGEAFNETRYEPEVCLVNEMSVHLERIRAIRNTIEHDSRPHIVEQGIDVRIDEKVNGANVLRVNTL